jgi:hypothetical protein
VAEPQPGFFWTADDADGADKTIREICVIGGPWLEADRCPVSLIGDDSVGSASFVGSSDCIDPS